MRRPMISATIVLFSLFSLAIPASVSRLDANGTPGVSASDDSSAVRRGLSPPSPEAPPVASRAPGADPSLPPADPTQATFSRLIQVVPPLPGVRVIVGGDRELVSDAAGIIRVVASARGDVPILALPWESPDGNTTAEFDRWGDNSFESERSLAVPGNDLFLGMRTQHLVMIELLDLDGQPIDLDRVDSVAIKSSLGNEVQVRAGEPTWLRGNRIVRSQLGGSSSPVSYSVSNVMIDGSNVVHRGQQRFEASETRWRVEVLLYSLEIVVRDLIFGMPVGSRVLLEFPDGDTREFDLGPGASLSLQSLARGEYRATPVAGGYAIAQPLAVTRDNRVDLRVISYLDIVFVVGLGSLTVVGLLAYARPGFRARLLAPVASLRRSSKGPHAPS